MGEGGQLGASGRNGLLVAQPQAPCCTHRPRTENWRPDATRLDKASLVALQGWMANRWGLSLAPRVREPSESHALRGPRRQHDLTAHGPSRLSKAPSRKLPQPEGQA